MSTEPYLLTPGPLTTSLRTRQSMLRDWGSWDVDFNAITGRVRERLLQIVHGTGTHECVPMQGSGTFSVEAAIGTLVPRSGHVLVPQNGAYCQRIARICRTLGRRLARLPSSRSLHRHSRTPHRLPSPRLQLVRRLPRDHRRPLMRCFRIALRQGTALAVPKRTPNEGF